MRCVRHHSHGSMDKLFDLMVMGAKYCLLCSTQLEDMIQVRCAVCAAHTPMHVPVQMTWIAGPAAGRGFPTCFGFGTPRR